MHYIVREISVCKQLNKCSSCDGIIPDDNENAASILSFMKHTWIVLVGAIPLFNNLSFFVLLANYYFLLPFFLKKKEFKIFIICFREVQAFFILCTTSELLIFAFLSKINLNFIIYICVKLKHLLFLFVFFITFVPFEKEIQIFHHFCRCKAQKIIFFLRLVNY